MKSGFGMTSCGCRYSDDDLKLGSTKGRRQPKNTSKGPYSFFSAVKCTFVLSFLLWWLPIFGQMIAGYVGGRRAGTPNRGMMAAIIPVGIITAAKYASNIGLIPSMDVLRDNSYTMIAALNAELPEISALLETVTTYINSFFNSIGSTTSLSINSYIITIVFAYVGGLLADQNRREIEYTRQSIPSGTPKRPFDSFNDCMPVKGRIAAKEEGRTKNTNTESRPRQSGSESPFNGLFHRAETNDPNRIKNNISSADELDYV